MNYIFKQVLWPVFLVYLGFVAILFLLQNFFVFVPPPLSRIDFSTVASYEKIEIITADKVTLKAFFHKPAKNKPILIEFHGNGSHPAWEAPKFQNLVKQGYGVLLAEYRGYGGSTGSPSEAGLYLDGAAYLDWIEKNREYKENTIIIYGSSIGSGVAVDVAAKNKNIDLLILEVPFDDLPLVAAWHYPYIPFIPFLMKNKFPNSEKINNIKIPVLFILAAKDKIIPMQFGRRLADMANQPKEAYILEDAGHLDVYNHGAAQIVDEFLKKHAND